MTQEDKELLLKDLCTRLPYVVKCTTKSMWNGIYTIVGYKDNRFFLDCTIYNEGDDEWMIESIVPYLRPMSSMTKEERNEYLSIKMQETERVALAEVYRPEAISEIIDWLNKHHFDYCGLIEKGLALKAPEGIYLY